MTLKIKTQTDVITNSSSEVFLIRTYGKTPQEIYDELLAVGDDGSSGMGGELVVSNSVGCAGSSSNSHEDMPKEFAVVDVDWSKDTLVQWLFLNYYVVDSNDTGNLVRDPKDGRALGLHYWENMKQYPKEWIDKDTGKLLDALFDELTVLDIKESIKDKEAWILKESERWIEKEKKAKEDEYTKNLWESWKSNYGTPQGRYMVLKDIVDKHFAKHPESIIEKLKYEC